MPLAPIEIIQMVEKRIQDFWDSWINQSVVELRQENEKLKEQVAKLQQNQEHQATTGVTSVISSEELTEIKRELAVLRELIKNLKSGPDQYDLKKEFPLVAFVKSKLQLDYTSAEITGAILNQVFKAQLKKDPNNPNGFKNYEFSPRVIEKNFTGKEWITPPTSIFNLGSMRVDNSYDFANPSEKKVTWGTGTGKSTFGLRAAGFRCLDNEEIKQMSEQDKREKLGATLLVPYSSLIGSVLDAHRNWLPIDDPNIPDEKKDERVIKCPLCGKRHTNYEIVHNGESSMLNVFTWWEFLDAYVNNPHWIKSLVIVDEAHTDTPAYRALIEGLEKARVKPFKMLQMSATFGDLPTSKKLTGTMTDYYVTDFAKVIVKNPEIFNKKIIIFVDDISKINLKPLIDNKIKFLILNDSLKDYATDIVRSMSAPLVVFANRDYSVGFSFGDVNVISTGVSTRTIIKNEKGTEQVIYGEKGSDFADLLQERGRGARDPNHTAVWMSLIPTNGDYKGKLKEDYFGKVVEAYFKKPDETNKKELTKVIRLAGRPKPIPELSQEEGNLNLNRILLRELKDKLDYSKIMTIKPSEKGKREPGEFIFTNKLMKYFQEEQLPDLLIEATKVKITAITQQYDWYQTPEEEDDYVFTSESDAKLVGFYLQAREKEKWEVKEKSAQKLVLKFSPYKLDKNKLKL